MRPFLKLKGVSKENDMFQGNVDVEDVSRVLEIFEELGELCARPVE